MDNSSEFFTPGLKKRKFPGPAGALLATSPDTPFKSSRIDIQAGGSGGSDGANISCKDMDTLSSSQSLAMGDLLSSAAWKSLQRDLGNDVDTVKAKFCIKIMILKAQRKLLPKGKIPLIVGVIESMDMQGQDASVLIRDTSGKMQGSLHRDLFKDPQTAMQVGSAVVLRQVSVISPSPRTHYLNITPGNVVLVYAPCRDGENIHRTPWQASPSPLRDAAGDSSAHIDDATVRSSLTEVVRESEQELSTPPRPRPCRSADVNTLQSQNSPMLHSPSYQPFRAHNSNTATPFRSPLHAPQKQTSSLFSSPVTPGTRNSNASPANYTAGTGTHSPVNFVNQRGVSNYGNSYKNYGNNNHPSRLSSKDTFLSNPRVSTPSCHMSNSSDKRNGEMHKRPFQSNNAACNELDTSFPDDDEDLLLLSCDVSQPTTEKSKPVKSNVGNGNKINSSEFSSASHSHLSPNVRNSLKNTGFTSECNREGKFSIRCGTDSQESMSPAIDARSPFEGINFSPDLMGSVKCSTTSTASTHHLLQTGQDRSASKVNSKDPQVSNQADDPDSERDSRIQISLGAVSPLPVPSAPLKTSHDDYWDNDLSDELLSQLTEEF